MVSTTAVTVCKFIFDQYFLNLINLNKNKIKVVNDTIDLFIEEIYRDTELWRNEMLPKLTQFYTECIAPEIVRNNIGNGFKCIDPIYIREAIRIYEDKKCKKNKMQL
ncbi:hypothetical protein RN001_002566 [Aquatica leii]|uniref:Uncharacterized protein n=1 Tax=Aquatica leii TaxID=1421715 RepID=A0AAN7QB62_9COLE|nr:hypothetical protein RN001_002566 [Aquatica leii]